MRQIPNILSVIRVLLIPLFVWQMLADQTTVAAAILVLSGLTDMLDGFLARRYNWISDVGKVLDPAADKLTQVTVCIMLVIKFPQYWFFFGLLLLKELVMLLLGGWLVRKKVHIEGARWFGKIVTILFYVITVLLIFFPNLPPWSRILMLTVFCVAAVFAGLMYIPSFLKYRNEAKKPEGGNEAASAE